MPRLIYLEDFYDEPAPDLPKLQTKATHHQNVALLEVAEPALLTAIMADREAARYVLAPLSDRVAVVAPGRYEALLARLRKIGHLPKTADV